MIRQKIQLFLVTYYLALVCGVGLALAFPRLQLSFLAFFALIPLFLSIRNLSSKQAFVFGFYTGLFCFSTLIYWIVPTVHIYGGLPVVLAVCTLFCLSLYLALYPAVFAYLVKKFSFHTWYAPLLAAALWTGLEYVRTYAFTGFSWGALGYSQYLNLNFIQIADFSGVYGVSFLIVLVNFALASVWVSWKEKHKISICVPAYTLFVLAATFGYGHYRIAQINTQMLSAPKTVVSVVQGNIEQDVKWDADFKMRTVEKYLNLSSDALQKHPDLVIWPETALPFYYGFDQVLSGKVDAFIRHSDTFFLIGSPAFKADEKSIKYFNRTYMLNPFAMVLGMYDKNHLVPFGEYVPFGDYLTFLGKITAQAGNFSTGDGTFTPLVFKDNRKTGILICFEILFPSISSGFVKNGADILTTITNDAWFGNTSAALQHFSIAVFRAVENRRSLARAANTGISGFVDPTGKILDSSVWFTDAVETRQLAILDRISFYTAHGDIFAIISIVAICFVFMIKGAKKMFGKKAWEKSK